MKKTMMLMIAVCVAHAGFSQISISPEAGLNISNNRLKVVDEDALTNDAKAGFSAGLGVNIPLYNGLYLKTGLYYNSLGNKSETGSVEHITHLHYLTLPVNIGYMYQLSSHGGSLFVEAGPYAGYALSGKNKTEGLPGGDTETKIEFGDGIAEMNSFDWGFNAGLGYETPWGIYIRGGYSLGLGNLSNVDDVKMTNSNWNIGLGYRLKL